MPRDNLKEAMLKAGQDPAFRKDWEDMVREGNAFEQMFSGKEGFEDVKYSDLPSRNHERV
jgi:hypothetical protein